MDHCKNTSVDQQNASINERNNPVANPRRVSILKQLQQTDPSVIPLECNRRQFSISSENGGTLELGSATRQIRKEFTAAPSTRNSGVGLSGKGESRQATLNTVLPVGRTAPMAAVGSMAAGMAGGGNNMKKLLEDLHNNRTKLEKNQSDYETARQNIETLDKDIASLRQESNVAADKWKELMEANAVKKSEIGFLEIKNTIVNEMLDTGEKELIAVVNDLHSMRLEVSQVSSKYLRDAFTFGMIYSGNNFSRQNRIGNNESEMEYLENYKNHLDSELADFLLIYKGVQKSEKDFAALSNTYDERDKVIAEQEQEIQARIERLESSLFDLEEEEKAVITNTEKECEKLKREIAEVNKRVANLEKESKDATSSIKTQTKSTKGQTQHSNRPVQSEQQTSKVRDSSVAAAGDSSKVKGHSASFKPPSFLQPQVKANENDVSHNHNFMDEDEFGDDEDCIAAAEAVSQSIRAYEPMVPCPSYIPPAKVRLVDRQASLAPLTFMKQLSTTKVVKRKPPAKIQAKTQQTQAASTQISSNTQSTTNTNAAGRKSFQFKKRTSNTLSTMDKGDAGMEGISHNIQSNANCNFPDDNFFGTNFMENDNDVITIDDDNEMENNEIEMCTSAYERPYSTFNSSRILLTRGQQEEDSFL